MIRLAWSRLRYRPIRGSETALLAAVLGALAAPSKLYVLACVLYLPAARGERLGQLGDGHECAGLGGSASLGGGAGLGLGFGHEALPSCTG